MLSYHRGQRRWFVWLTFLIAILLSILPLPQWAVLCQPEWVCLVLIYWLMALPEVVGVGTAFILGILLDLIQGVLLGEHALALIVITYIVIKFHLLVRVYPLLQQTFIVFLLLLLYKVVIFAIQGFLGLFPYSILYWFSAIVSALLWSWVFVLLRDWRRKVGVS